MRAAKKTRADAPASTEQWFPGEGRYPSVFALEAHFESLAGRGGVFVLWHLGVRPQWLNIGAATDLAAALVAAAQAPEIVRFRGNGGVYAAWAFPARAQWPAIVASLRSRLQPAAHGDTEYLSEAETVAFPPPQGTTP